MAAYEAQCASRLGKSIVTALTTLLTNVTQSTTAFSAQTYQVRVVHNVSANGIWATIGTTVTDVTAASSAALIPQNTPEYFAVTAGQHFNWMSTSTTTGYLCVTEIV